MTFPVCCPTLLRCVLKPARLDDGDVFYWVDMNVPPAVSYECVLRMQGMRDCVCICECL